MPQSPTPYSGSPPVQPTSTLDNYFNVSLTRLLGEDPEVLAGIATFLAAIVYHRGQPSHLI